MAILSILFLGVFQFLINIISFRTRIENEGLKRHRVVSATELLRQDLMGIPRGKRNFEANRNEFFRNTVSHEGEEVRLLDARIHYFVEKKFGDEILYRNWKWKDIHNEYQEREEILKGSNITIRYQVNPGKWVSATTNTDQVKIKSVKIKWGNRSVIIPVASGKRSL